MLRGLQIHIPKCQEQGGAQGGLEPPAAHGVVGIRARVVLGAQGATVGCQQCVATAISCRDIRKRTQRGSSLPQFARLVRPSEQPLGTCSLFKSFPQPKHHFLVAFLDAPGTGNCPQGDPGMKLLLFPPQPRSTPLNLQLVYIPQSRRTAIWGDIKGFRERICPLHGAVQHWAAPGTS